MGIIPNSRSGLRFDLASLQAQLLRLPVPQRYCIAFSGGVDSHVLVHAMAQLREDLPCKSVHAIHINHGIHPDAEQWTRHCELVCQQLAVTYESHVIRWQAKKGQSLEADARMARYAALRQNMRQGDMLLLAHHQDDQTETVLLQLFRGSGVKGLAGMPVCVKFARGWLARPLLGLSREALHEYATSHQLAWVEDPSNLDTKFDRNFLRHAVLPLMRQRWPALGTTLARSAMHLAEADGILETVAQQDYLTLADTDPQVLHYPRLLQLAPDRQRNVLRYWLHRVCALPLPDTMQLQRILDEVLPAAADAVPIVHWQGAEVHRYRNALYAITPQSAIEPGWTREWNLREALPLPTAESLSAQSAIGIGLRRSLLYDGVTVTYRQGGEQCRLPGRQHRHALKKLFQAWGIPPWRRERIPLVFIQGELAQVVGYCVCAPFAAEANDEGVQIILKPLTSTIETADENKDNSPGCTP